MRGRRADVIIAGGLVAVAGYVVYEASLYPASVVPGSPGPGLYPTVVAALIGGLAVLLLLRSRRSGSDGDESGGGSVRRALAALTLVIVFVATLESADVFVGLAVLLAATMWLMGERRRAALVSVPVLFDLFVYLVFYRAFAVPLPTLVF